MSVIPQLDVGKLLDEYRIEVIGRSAS